MLKTNNRWHERVPETGYSLLPCDEEGHSIQHHLGPHGLHRHPNGRIHFRLVWEVGAVTQVGQWHQALRWQGSLLMFCLNGPRFSWHNYDTATVQRSGPWDTNLCHNGIVGGTQHPKQKWSVPCMSTNFCSNIIKMCLLGCVIWYLVKLCVWTVKLFFLVW